MAKKFYRYPWSAAVAIGTIVTGCVPEAESDQDIDTVRTESNLFVKSGTQLWDWNQHPAIPICFTQSAWLLRDHAREKNIILQAIRRSWPRVAHIPVTYYGDCPTTGSAQFVKINLGPHTSTDGSTDGQTSVSGMATLTAASTPVYADITKNPGVRIWVQDDGQSEQSRMEYVAIHEFGHVLGFEHEQDRPGNTACGGKNIPGTGYGPYDPDSIMNYCADTQHGYLSAGDIASVRAIYGATPNYANFSADVNGDGKADALVVNSDAIYVMLSNGVKFNWSGAWTTFPFFGYRETLVADVNGDHRADAIAVDNSGNYVMLSDGTKFNWAGKWSAPFNGTYKTLAADFNGDGKSDLLVVNNKGLFVMLSDGTKFNWAGQWWGGAFMGTRNTWAGDVNGDHLADIVEMSINGWVVLLNTGSSFVQASSGTYSANSRVAAIADADGDGKADLVALNDWGINVSLSNGNGFGPVAFSSWPFWGDHASLLADVNGDGKVDGIAVNTWGQYVAESTGRAFVWGGQWSGAFISQPY